MDDELRERMIRAAFDAYWSEEITPYSEGQREGFGRVVDAVLAVFLSSTTPSVGPATVEK